MLIGLWYSARAFTFRSCVRGAGTRLPISALSTTSGALQGTAEGLTFRLPFVPDRRPRWSRPSA